MSLPENIKGYENLAESLALFEEREAVIYDPAPGLISVRSGIIKWRRWECGNQCWGYSVTFDAGGSTMSVESNLRRAGVSK